MNENYRSFFGLNKEPFSADIGLKDILATDQLVNAKTRLDYVIRLGAVGLVTGDVGSGKSTAIRYAQGNLHPSFVPNHLYHRLIGLYHGVLPATVKRTVTPSPQQLEDHHAPLDQKRDYRSGSGEKIKSGLDCR